jgi:uncharacterized protein
MRIVVSGATGMIGRALVSTARARGDSVVALSRDPQRAAEVLGDEVEPHAWTDPMDSTPPAEALAGADAVVNLMGEQIAQRWTEESRRRIRDSRVLGTRSLVEGIRALDEGQRPQTLVSQSAAGFYGHTGDRPLDESAPAGSGFLAGVVVAWEQEARAAAPLMRVVLPRTGVVLSSSGGALAKMLPFFRLGLGGPVAGGRQYVPWIHLDDIVAGLLFCVDNREAERAVNLAAPTPVTNAELSKTLGRVLGRPAVLPVPAAGLRLLYGEMSEVVTTGQRMIPAKLQRLGYEFRYSELEPALRDVLGSASPGPPS